MRIPCSSGEMDICSVIYVRVRSDYAVFSSRPVNRNRLNRRTGRSFCIHGTIQDKICIFLSEAAGEAFYFSCIRIHDNDSALHVLCIFPVCTGDRTYIIIHSIYSSLDGLIITAVNLISGVVEEISC